jgi:hypothetical protein
LLTIFVFMFVQDPVLGAAAVAFFPLQGYLIPKLQRIIRRLGRTRVQKVRHLSDRIGETISARREIRVNHGAPYQLADIAHRLGEIYDIRFEIYNRKFFVKFLNNFIGSLTPFFFYAIGGYLVIKGQLSIGALTAVIAAFKELSSPWKELLDFYQNHQDVAIKYEQVVEQFNVTDMLDRRLLLEEPEKVETFSGRVAAANVGLVDADGIHLLDSINFEFPLGADVAIVGTATAAEISCPNSSPGLSFRRAGGSPSGTPTSTCCRLRYRGVASAMSGRRAIFSRRACATIFSSACVIARDRRPITTQPRRQPENGRSRRRGSRGTAISTSQPTGSTIGKPVWRTR